ncbi:Zn-dependent proteases [Yersinia enterocolitica]|nr:Zn-dependent proteases [Yersinia enterocolitica]
MQHAQSGCDGSNINGKHDGSVFREAKPEEVSRDDVYQVRYDKRQAGSIGNKPGGHDKGQRCPFAEPQRKQHGDDDGGQDKRSTVVSKERRYCCA